MNATAGGETRLLWPALKGFYDPFFEVAYAVMRIVIGYIFLMHGWAKIGMGAGAVAANIMAKNGLEPAIAFAYAAMFLETVGAICIILGLFTRFFAAAAAVEMLIITWLYWKAGFSWLNRGYEYTLLWGLVCFAIALRGGGPYSLDRKLGVQL